MLISPQRRMRGSIRCSADRLNRLALLVGDSSIAHAGKTQHLQQPIG